MTLASGSPVTVGAGHGLHLLRRPRTQLPIGRRCAAFLDKESPKAYVRQMAEHDDAGITPDVWSAIVDLGLDGRARARRSDGGLGLGLVDAVVVQEEMGRGVFPGPYFSSAILATLAARALGLDDRLAGPREPGASAARSRSTRSARGARSNASGCAPTGAATATASTA